MTFPLRDMVLLPTIAAEQRRARRIGVAASGVRVGCAASHQCTAVQSTPLRGGAWCSTRRPKQMPGSPQAPLVSDMPLR